MLRPPWGGLVATSHCKAVPTVLRDHGPLTAQVPGSVVWDLFCDIFDLPPIARFTEDGTLFPVFTDRAHGQGEGKGKGKGKGMGEGQVPVHTIKDQNLAIMDQSLPYAPTPEEAALLAREEEIQDRAQRLGARGGVWVGHVQRVFGGDYAAATLDLLQPGYRDERLDVARAHYVVEMAHWRKF